jgi:hypothetical protein
MEPADPVCGRVLVPQALLAALAEIDRCESEGGRPPRIIQCWNHFSEMVLLIMHSNRSCWLLDVGLPFRGLARRADGSSEVQGRDDHADMAEGLREVVQHVPPSQVVLLG